MTINEAIQAACAAREGSKVSEADMIRWLSYVDGRVMEELILTHRDDLTARQEAVEEYDKRIRLLEEQLAEIGTGGDSWIDPDADRLRDEIIAVRSERDLYAAADYSELDPDTVLYIRAPFEDIYIYFLVARIDLLNRESSSHNDNMRQYYTEWKRYANWYNRNSAPTGSGDIAW